MTLRVDGEGLPALRHILGARSLVRKAMFSRIRRLKRLRAESPGARQKPRRMRSPHTSSSHRVRCDRHAGVDPGNDIWWWLWGWWWMLEVNPYV